MNVIECGGGQGDGGKRLAVVMLRRGELVYDIRNCCYIEGHVMPEDADETRHTVQDVGEEGNVDRVTRMLDLAHAELVERLLPMTRRELDDPLVTNRLAERGVYGVVLEVGRDFSQSTLNLLGKLIHEAMVSWVVADWMSITNPGKADVWRAKADELLTRVSGVKGHRVGRLRIRPHWLG